MANRAQIIGIGLDGKTREPKQIQQSELAKKTDLEVVKGTIPSAEDVAANTAARHTKGTDQGLDTGGANAVTAAEIVAAIAEISGKFPEIPYDALFTSASNNAPGRYHVPGAGQTSANVILGNALDQYFYIDLSQGPTSCDISMIGSPGTSDIITFPGGVVATATVHTFDLEDRGGYRYWVEDLTTKWRLHVELLHERNQGAGGGAITITPLPNAKRTCTNTAVANDVKNADLDLEFGGGTADGIFTFTGEEIEIAETGDFRFSINVRIIGNERVNGLVKLWKYNTGTTSWDLLKQRVDYITRGITELSGDISADFLIAVVTGDIYKFTVQGRVTSTRNATLVPSNTWLDIVRVGGVKGDTGDTGPAGADGADGYDPGTWATLSYATGYSNATNYRSVEYRKDGAGIVFVRGSFTRTSGSATLVFTLPPGFRPTAREAHGATLVSGSLATVALDCATNGEVDMIAVTGAISTQQFHFTFSFDTA